MVHAKLGKIRPFQKYAKKVVWPFLLHICVVLKTMFHEIRERALFEKMREMIFEEKLHILSFFSMEGLINSRLTLALIELEKF